MTSSHVPASLRRTAHVFIISGPSGGGKTTLIARLLRAVRGVKRSVSVTTRPKRSEERGGRDYTFVSLETFQRLRRAGRLLEWAKVHGAYYGTPRQWVLSALARGQDVLLGIDVQGARQVRRALGRRAVLIFLLPPSMAKLRRRLLGRRTETRAAVQRRLVAARREIACARWYDYAIVNDRLDGTVANARAIVEAFRRRGCAQGNGREDQDGARRG